jgi:uncharacterized repeat protein (TIGR01451 family)
MWRKPAAVLLPAMLAVVASMSAAGPSAQAAPGAPTAPGGSASAVASGSASPVAASSAASTPAPAVSTKASTKADKIPATVQRVVAGTATSGAITDGSVRSDAGGRVELDFHATGPTGESEEADLAGLGAAGVRTLSLSPDLHVTTGMVEAWVPREAVTAAAALPWVTSVTVPAYAHTSAVTSAGVALHKADVAQAKGLTGAGVTVGVVSDGVASLATSQAAGELPPVDIVDPTTFGPGTGDEGTAMLEIVHDMAPGAALDFHAAGIGDVATPLTFVLALDALHKAGANVIVHDVGFLGEPVFQAGIVAQVIDGLTAAGVSVHSAAGNAGDTHTARVTATGSGSGPDASAGPYPSCGVTPPTNAVAIGPNAKTSFDVTLFPGAESTFALQWSEPRSIFPTAGQGGFTDLDLFLMTDDLSDCLSPDSFSSSFQGNGAGDPIEVVSGHLTGTTPLRAKLVVSAFVDPAVTPPSTPPTLDLRWTGAAAAVDPPTRAGSLDPVDNFTSGLPGAAAAVDAKTGEIEPFSGGGPVNLFTTTNCPPDTTKAEDQECPLSAGTTVGTFQGPAWAAADDVAVSGAGGFPTEFQGTSAAAPHAGGCDALVRQAIGRPDAPVKEVHDRLASTAVDVGAPGVDDVSGAGILDCAAASTVSDIALTYGVGPTEPAPGDTVSYTLNALDNGPDPGTGLALTATLPDGVSFASSGSGCTADAQTVSCPLTDLATDQTASFTFDATVDSSVESGTELASTATVVGPFDAALDDNTATASVTAVVPVTDLGNLAATGSPRLPTLPIGLGLLAAAVAGLALTRRSRLIARR